MRTAKLIVGTDGSPPSLMALRWAAREAQSRGVPLTVLLAYTWRTRAMQVLGNRDFEEYVRDLALAIVDAAVAEARTIAPRARVHGSAVFGEPAPVLLHASDEANMVVVGARGNDATAPGRGSVSTQIATQASCPMTAIVRGRTGVGAGPAVDGVDAAPAVDGVDAAPAVDGVDTAPVVVGVDGTASADFATGIAFEEAARRSCALMAVFAYDGPALPGQVTEWQDKYPEVPVGYAVSRDRPAATLTSWSRRAQLVVVGGRTRRTGHCRPRRPVDLQLIHRSACPVLIARTNDTHRRRAP